MRLGLMRGGVFLVWVLGACGPGLGNPQPLPPEDPDIEVPPVRPPPSVTLPPISLGDVVVVDAMSVELEVQVLGAGFHASSLVYLNQARLETSFVSGTELRARVPRHLLSQSRDSYLLWVRTPPGAPGQPGGATSPFTTFVEPAPELHSLSPEVVDAAPSAPVRITVKGKNLIRDSVALFRGGRHPLIVRSPTEGTVELLPSVVASPSEDGLFQLEVPWPRGYTTITLRTAALPLPVRTPTPTVAGIWPPTLNAVGQLQGRAGQAKSYSIEVSGTKLRANTVVKWNGRPLTTYSSPFEGRIRADLPADARMQAATIQVSLETPSDRGPLVSGSYPLVVKTEPVVYAVSPARVDVNDTGTTFELRGEGLGESKQQVLLWNGTPLPPESFEELSGGPPYDRWTFRVPSHLLNRPGVFPVTVRRTYDGAESAPLFVHVVTEAPAPLVDELTPAMLSVGDAPGTVALGGAGFTPRSVIQVNGQERLTRFDTSGHLTTDLIPSDLEQKGVLSLTVRTPPPGGGTSLPLLLAVHAERSVPFIDAVTGPGGENPVMARDDPMTLHVQGQGFTPDSVVRWQGVPMPTQWQCLDTPCRAGPGQRSELTAVIPAAQARTSGPARVTVFTPGPGGGESRERYLVITSEVEPRLSLNVQEMNIRPSEEGQETRLNFTLSGASGTQVTQLLVDGVERPFNNRDGAFSLNARETATQGILAVRVQVQGKGLSAPAYLYLNGARTPRIHTLKPGVLSQDPLGPEVFPSTLWVEGQDLSWTGEPTRMSRLQLSVRMPPQPPVREVSNMGSGIAFGQLWLESPGVRTITLSRVSEGGGQSLPALLNVVPERPAPLLTKLEPMSAKAGAPRLRLRIWGQGLHTDSQLRWKDFRASVRPVRFFSSDANNYEAELPAAALATTGAVDVTLETPGPGGGTSLPIRVVVE
ncbi:TonB-dependent receptor [Myxococcus stipitatus DSM 14675]|uniref:TonB-dependent receptor n=1 Tax=Myxococcus stipitatus (strain DSM 14675 / JCM 12634 / Mx s8) TaxID=1278073 RepID=L7U226_MYXSD|nr:hypothetical protein [Myxococcus stipitatus]AGC41652.1 TonB-dependent receptor [Myxococcus stipitatus DSM 14675]